MASKTLVKSIPAALGELDEHLKWDTVSLTITDPDLTYDRWERIGALLGHFHNGAAFWIGDWINFGEAIYGEEAAQAVESTVEERYDVAHRITGLAPQTLQNYRSVCEKVARSRRKPGLPMSIHAAVAPYTPEEQTAWLDRCLEEGWKVADLRAALHEAKGDDGEPGDNGTAGSSGLADGLTPGERLEAAARLVFHQGQPQRDGNVVVPGEAWQHLSAALGEE